MIIRHGCARLQLAALPDIASTYAVDPNKSVAGSISVSITCQQEPLGLRFLKVYHSVNLHGWLRVANHDKNDVDNNLMSIQYIILVCGKDDQDLEQGSKYVGVAGRFYGRLLSSFASTVPQGIG